MSNVRDFGAAGDGRHDDTDAIVHALEQGDGVLRFPPGEYLLSRTVRVELDQNAVPVRRDGLLEIVRSRRVNMNGCQLLDGQPYGIYLEDSEQVSITGSSVLETRDERKSRAAIRWRGKGSGNFVAANTLAKGTEETVVIDDESGVKLGENLVV